MSKSTKSLFFVCEKCKRQFMYGKESMHLAEKDYEFGSEGLEPDEYKKGFTLIEILVVIGIIAVLASVVLVAINPARQFKLARDSQRTSNVEAMLNAVSQDIAEHRGVFVCGTTQMSLPTVSTDVKNDGLDLAPCLVPDYISALPFDPLESGGHWRGTADYDTEYFLNQDSLGRITVNAVGEITPSISVTR